MRYWSEAAVLDRHAELLVCARAPQQHSENVTAQLLLPAHFDWFVSHLNIKIESLIKSNLRNYQNIVQLWISHLCSYLMNCLLRTWGHFAFICRAKQHKFGIGFSFYKSTPHVYVNTAVVSKRRSIFAKPLKTKKVGSSVVIQMTEVKAQLLTVNVLFGLTSGSCRTPSWVRQRQHSCFRLDSD